MSSRWVLITDGGNGQARSTLAAVRALAAAGYRPAVTVSAPHSLAAASRHCARRVTVPPVDAEGYPAAVRAELDARPYLTVMPTSDAALLALGAPVVNLVDKLALVEAAEAVGLGCPPTRPFRSARDLIAGANDLEYPVVVKPTVSRYSARRASSPADLAAFADAEGSLLVQPFIDDELRSVAGVVWRDRLVAAVHQRYLRTWPPDCGGACAAETTEPRLELEDRLLPLLDGYEGVFHAQFAGSLLLDVNPRLYGSLPLAVAAGANLAAIHCDLLRGRRVGFVRGRPGVFYRSLEGDLRHRAGALRRREIGLGEALRSLRPRQGAAHGPESLTDPGPMLVRLRFAAGSAAGRRSHVERRSPTTPQAR